MNIETFLARCDTYCTQKGMSESRLSTIIFGSGVTLGRLREGKGVTVRVLDRAVERLVERERTLAAERAAAGPVGLTA